MLEELPDDVIWLPDDDEAFPYAASSKQLSYAVVRLLDDDPPDELSDNPDIACWITEFILLDASSSI